ncbi:MAG: HDOD domain-containing protein [Planctomycetes bacterium]|nr:HDOD domain-containing protein [Planctomycetota bacterium]
MLQHETIEAIMRSASIPSMPMVATRCYEMTQDAACDYGKLVELLSTDPGIAADVLRLSNSALFGVTRQVASLRQAISLLGVKRIRELVLARYLVQQMQKGDAEVVDISYYWRRSLATAILAAKFADTLCPAQRDEAFIGGLLADVGIVVMGRALPVQYAPVAERYKPNQPEDWLHSEVALMGVAHGEVSALVIEQWGLPVSLVEAVRYHHSAATEMPTKGAGVILARAIGGAQLIAKILSEATDGATAVNACTMAMNRVNLNTNVLIKSLDGIDAEIRNVADLLKVEVLNSKLFTTLGRQLIENLHAVEMVV